MLYKKDYFKLSAEELAIIDKAKDYVSKCNGTFSMKQLFRYHKLMPNYGYHHESLFPNNFLYSNYEKHEDSINLIFTEFINLISNQSASERDILNFIHFRESYFVLESILMNYNFGHHGSFLFREFELPPNHVADFLIVGERSGGPEFLFIELEHPYKDITTKDGDWGSAFRKGFKQIEAWETWIDGNYSFLKSVFKKYQNLTIDLPAEYYELDKSRIHFLVIAGRRNDFNSKTYRLARKLPRNTKIMHYDNIIDSVENYLNTNLKSWKERKSL